MRTQHVLLLSIVLSIPALAAEPKPPGNVTGKSGDQDQAASSSDAARRAVANDEAMPARPARKKRVHHTFPPSTKRM